MYIYIYIVVYNPPILIANTETYQESLKRTLIN